MSSDNKELGLKYDHGKPRYDLLPPVAIDELAKILTFGAEKYAPNSWQKVEHAKERYTAALLRHLYAWLGGEYFDPESGLPHLYHVGANLMFLLHFEDDKSHV